MVTGHYRLSESDVLGIMVDVNPHHEKGDDYLCIVVEAYPSPISYKGQYHYRSGSTKQELKGAALEQFLLKKRGRTWDAVPMPELQEADLDPLAFVRFRKLAEGSGRVDADALAGSDALLLDRLNLRDGIYLKRATALLFAREPERLTIWNPATLPDDWTEDKLLEEHSSRPYNPSIAATVFRAGEIETWGRGIERIVEACREARNPLPEITYSHGELQVTFRYSQQYLRDLTGKNIDSLVDLGAVGTTQKFGKGFGKEFGKGFGQTEQAVLSAMFTRPTITIPQLAEALALTPRAIEKQVKKLREAGLLRRVGGRKNGHWEVLE